LSNDENIGPEILPDTPRTIWQGPGEPGRTSRPQPQQGAHRPQPTASQPLPPEAYDYSFVGTSARIACYDDFRSAPRIIEVGPAPTTEHIESLTSKVYEQAKLAGGAIPYTVIREVTENFIHARFSEVVVSIFDKGNVIRFSDQGPGIDEKHKAQLPGFTSAVEPMKKYIRGVGSGFPLVKEYLDFSQGSISIEDNLKTGAVVTISLVSQPEKATAHEQPATGAKPTIRPLTPPLNDRERDFLSFFNTEGALGITDLVRLTGAPQSSTYVTLSRLEEYGLVEKTYNQKRILTDLGFKISEDLK